MHRCQQISHHCYQRWSFCRWVNSCHSCTVLPSLQPSDLSRLLLSGHQPAACNGNNMQTKCRSVECTFWWSAMRTCLRSSTSASVPLIYCLIIHTFQSSVQHRSRIHTQLMFHVLTVKPSQRPLSNACCGWLNPVFYLCAQATEAAFVDKGKCHVGGPLIGIQFSGIPPSHRKKIHIILRGLQDHSVKRPPLSQPAPGFSPPPVWWPPG